jgi:hypothetical protein
MKKIKFIIYTGAPEPWTITFECRHMVPNGRQFRFYNCEDRPDPMREHVEPTEILDISPGHTFAMEIL